MNFGREDETVELKASLSRLSRSGILGSNAKQKRDGQSPFWRDEVCGVSVGNKTLEDLRPL